MYDHINSTMPENKLNKKEKYQPQEYIVTSPYSSIVDTDPRFESIIAFLNKTFSFLASLIRAVTRNITLKGIRTALITIALLSPVYQLLGIEIDRQAAVQKAKDNKAFKERRKLWALMDCYKVSSVEALKKARKRSRGCRI